MKKGRGHRQALLDAARKRLRRTLSHAGKVKSREKGFDARRRVFFTESVGTRKKGQVFFRRQRPVERKLLRHVPQAPTRFGTRLPHVAARDRQFAFRDVDQAAEHPESRRFPRAVGPEKSEDFPGMHVKRRFIDRRKRPEAPHDVASRNHGIGNDSRRFFTR